MNNLEVEPLNRGLKVYDKNTIQVFTSELYGMISATGFVGRSKKPRFNFRFKSEAERTAWVAKWIEKTEAGLIARAKYKADLKFCRKQHADAFKASLKVGTILSDSWGYEQTNVEFYIVTEVKDSTVTLQELGHIQDGEANSWASCYVLPDTKSPQGAPIKKRVVGSAVRLCSSIALTLWDGRRCYKSWYA